MAAGQVDKKEDPIGFSGLSSLVSDVEPILSTRNFPEKRVSGVSSSSEHRSTPESKQTQSQAKVQQPDSVSSKPSSGGSSINWVIVFIAFVSIVVLIGKTSNSFSPSKTAYSPSPSPTPAANIEEPIDLPVPVTAQPEKPSRLDEAKPPIGQSLTLSIPQIRYCLAEDIRLEAAKVVLNNYNDSDINKYNAMVNDYNSRCGSFRYRNGTLESARRDVENFREPLEEEGRNRFARNLSTGSLSTPTKAPIADALVQEVQQKLNELGYDVGTANGFMGQSTYSAIQNFQRNNGLPVTGQPSPELLVLLTLSHQQKNLEQPFLTADDTAPGMAQPHERSNGLLNDRIPQNARINEFTNNWECNRGYFKLGSECHAVQIPQHGKLTFLGNDWECNRGYFKFGSECRVVQIPQHGKLTFLGNDWECNQGYFKFGNECRVVQIPQNGKLTFLGNDWECNRGYFKFGNECRVVQIPQNGKLTFLGNDWECNQGYYKLGNECRIAQMR